MKPNSLRTFFLHMVDNAIKLMGTEIIAFLVLLAVISNFKVSLHAYLEFKNAAITMHTQK